MMIKPLKKNDLKLMKIGFLAVPKKSPISDA